jgi:hypothetical protein
MVDWILLPSGLLRKAGARRVPVHRRLFSRSRANDPRHSPIRPGGGRLADELRL